MDPQPYNYRSLSDDEIRVIDILPGNLRDDIRLQISHIHLGDIPASPKRPSRAEVQATLGPGWEVFETPEGRYLFCYDPEDDSTFGDDESAEFLTTWQHPDSTYNQAVLELPSREEIWGQGQGFEALSYVWGSQETLVTAVVEEDDGSAIGWVFLGINLANALRYLRYTDRSRRIWVDAICINQSDEAEKAVQVGRMKQLYKQALRVMVWVGKEEDESDLAISTLQHLGQQVETTLDGFRLTSPGAEEPEWYNIDVELPYDMPTWDAIVNLVSRPWFSRLWTAQEIILANRFATLQCGSATILWSIFRRAIECILDKSDVPRGREAISFVRTSIFNGIDRPLSQIIKRLSSRRCQDPHDKIYGIFGMATPSFRAAMTPNYQQPYADTYKKAFLINSFHIKRWEIFGCDPFARSIQAPSWVPDLWPIATNSTGSKGQYSSGSSELCMEYQAPDLLKVAGLRFSVVVSVGSFVRNSSSKFMTTVRSWIESGVTETTKDMFIANICQGWLRERHPEQHGWPTLREWRRYCENMIFRDDTRRSFNRESYMDDLLFRACEGRALIRMENGSMGLGPKDAEAGDVVCVVLGCDQPLLLRPLPGGQYTLMGHCFVYELQDSYALLGPIPTPWQAQILNHPTQEFRRVYKFYNAVTKKLTSEDPRLGKLDDWERISDSDLGRELTGDDPEICDFFRNAKGKIVNSDPRLSKESLLARGVALETLSIV